MQETPISCCPRCVPGNPWPSGLLGTPISAFKCANCGCHGRSVPDGNELVGLLGALAAIEDVASNCLGPQQDPAIIVDENPATTPTAGGSA